MVQMLISNSTFLVEMRQNCPEGCLPYTRPCVPLQAWVRSAVPVQGILNYVILRPLMTAVSFVATLCHVYGDGELRFDRVYIYVVAVNNFSQVGLRALCPPRSACLSRYRQ